MKTGESFEESDHEFVDEVHQRSELHPRPSTNSKKERRARIEGKDEYMDERMTFHSGVISCLY